MRDCALWISHFVGEDEERIVDTAAMTPDDRALFTHDPDTPPSDTVLVVIHPRRHMDLKAAVAEMNPITFMDFADANGRHVAAYLITKRCSRDRALARRLRWFDTTPAHFQR